MAIALTMTGTFPIVETRLVTIRFVDQAMITLRGMAEHKCSIVFDFQSFTLFWHLWDAFPPFSPFPPFQFFDKKKKGTLVIKGLSL